MYVIGSITIILAAVGLWLAMFFGHFWLYAYEQNKTARIINSGYAHQSALQTDLTYQIGQVIADEEQAIRDKSNPTLRADDKVSAILAGRKACADAANLTLPIHGSTLAWVGKNCEAGNLSPSSTLSK